MNDKFFQLLRLAIGSSEVIPHIEKEEWRDIYEMARKQSLLGVIFDGVQKMSDVAKLKGESMEMDVDLLMTWMGKSKQIEKRNHQLDEAVVKVSAWFQKKCFRTCILKGQGNALMYPHPAHRTPGDIDLWVSGKPSDVIRFVHSIAPDEKASYHHIDFPAFNGIPVEVHYRPCYLQNPLHNHRLQRFFEKYAEEQFSNEVALGDGKIAIPTASFNAVYQLVHIYNHLFQEGIGLRQIVDYYFVIDKWHTDLTDSTDISRRMDNRYHTDLVSPSVADLQFTDSELNSKKQYAVRKAKSVESVRSVCEKELKCLGLWKFAGAVMYVLHEALGLSEEKIIAPIDEKRGRMLLEEILAGGNFGQHDGRYGFGHGAIGHNLQRLCRDGRLVKYYPAEALSEPIFRMWHFFWRKFHQ